ncbi:MAG: hypothetical protein HQM16_15940 [Deltaproteobacteria bacterium]|nr:hypothetical protein [Deltaproteobacteria bacterium]
MTLSKTKIIFFFVTIFLLGWMLYPNKLFLAYVYEGQSKLAKAEGYYLRHLEKRPHSKLAVMRLANLYHRMAAPEKALPILDKLYNHRKNDWDLAMYYLSYVQDTNDAEATYKLTRTLANNFIDDKKIAPIKIEELLDSAYQHALWTQKYDDAYKILADIIRISKRPDDYIYDMTLLDRGFKRTGHLIKLLNGQFKKNPANHDIIHELAAIYLVTKDYNQAKKIINHGLTLDNKNPEFLKLAIDIHERSGDIKTAIKLAQTLISVGSLHKDDLTEQTRRLARLHAANGEKTIAVNIYKSLLKEDRTDPQNWHDLIDYLQTIKNQGEFLDYLSSYTNEFPDDIKYLKILMDTCLYDLMDYSRLDLYLDGLTKEPRITFALDVAYGLINQNNRPLAQIWLDRIDTLFKGNRVVLDLKIDNLIALKQYKQALGLIENYLYHHQNDKEMILLAIQIYMEQAGASDIERLLDQLVRVDGANAQTLVFAAKELYYMGAANKAENYIKQAIKLNSSIENWHWLTEISYALSQKKQTRRAAEHVIALFHKIRTPTLEDHRLWFKARGRFKFTKYLTRDYNRAIKDHPDHIPLRYDFIDLLLENKKTSAAESEISRFADDFPGLSKEIRPYKARLAMLKNDWGQAFPMLEALIKEQPHSVYLKQDLATTYAKLGEWPAALDLLESIKIKTAKNDTITQTIRALRDLHDYRTYAEYLFADFGRDEIMSITTGFRGHVSKKFMLSADIHAFKAGVSALNNTQFSGKAFVSLTSHHLTDIVLKLGAGAGISEARKTPSLSLDIGYEPLDNLALNLQTSLRDLRTDIPTAISAGVLEDTASLEFNFTPVDRVLFYAKYDFNRSYLKTGAYSIEHTLEPRIGFVLLKKPYLTAGYQFTWSKISNHNGFFNSVALIPEMNAHYFTLNLSHDLLHNLALSTNFFIGEDFKRDLRLFKGDLFGGGVGLKWRVHPSFIIESSYAYGRETLSGIAGDYHQWTINLTGYWGSHNNNKPR